MLRVWRTRVFSGRALSLLGSGTPQARSSQGGISTEKARRKPEADALKLVGGEPRPGAAWYCCSDYIQPSGFLTSWDSSPVHTAHCLKCLLIHFPKSYKFDLCISIFAPGSGLCPRPSAGEDWTTFCYLLI